MTLLTAAAIVAIVSLSVATVCRNLIPRYRAVHQSASWREALQGAEAGVNHTIQVLNEFTTTSRTAGGYDWSGNGWTFTDANYKINGERTLNTASLPVLGGANNVAVSRVAVDVYTRNPDVRSYYPWFRIRSTARADLPDRFLSGDRRDNELRRMKLSARKAGKSAPYVTRTVEVIVKPRFRFLRPLTTISTLSLAESSGWVVDSFDSSNPDKSDAGTSAGGIYPSDPAKRLANGDIATLNQLPSGVSYAPLIVGNGATVKGEVFTSGGDNPATPTHENVSGSSGMDQNRIFDTFDEYIPLPTKPVWPMPKAVPVGKTNFQTGTESDPYRYIVNDGLGAFTVLPPLPGRVGYVEILVNGTLDIGSGGGASIVIPPNVFATIYVDGDIKFNNGMVNSDSLSSQVATQLTIFGVSTSSNARYQSSGNGVQTLSFYGPNYNVLLSGTTITVGAMISKTFMVDGGGSGGFHYDEALGKGGDISGWEVASYFEDTRGN